MNHFIMLGEGDIIAVSEIKRIRNRSDGFTDVWLKGETQSHLAKLSFGEFVNKVVWCHQNNFEPLPEIEKTIASENSLTLPRPPPPPIRARRQFPVSEDDE